MRSRFSVLRGMSPGTGSDPSPRDSIQDIAAGTGIDAENNLVGLMRISHPHTMASPLDIIEAMLFAWVTDGTEAGGAV